MTIDRKEYQKKWRLENKEYHKEYYKKWKKANRDRLREYKKQYQVENKEKIKEYMKKYSLENKERLKQYRVKNKEKISNDHKIWSQNHRLTFLDKRITVDFIERTFSCMCCRFQGSTNLHHIKYDLNDPLKYTVELCDSCHILWHWEDNYLRFGVKRFLPYKELMIENGDVK